MSAMSELERRIAENVGKVRHAIADAAAKSGRSPDSVALIAVTKYVSPDVLPALAAAGCQDFGESRPQELWRRSSLPGLEQVRWHMIGHLQRNKIARTLPLTTLLHSVDSPRLLDALQHETGLLKLSVRCLLEVNISGDAAKHGFPPHEMAEVVRSLGRYPSVNVCGLMAMSSAEGGTETARRNFADLRRLRDELQTECPDGVALTELSMGMSDDFEEAIAEGATMVRIGSALFDGIA
jgi:pyridoxal phosphate enzyme (YggS family)